MIGLQNVSWKAGDFMLRDISCFVPDGEYAVLMGPTGCGKTTVIEIICGLRLAACGTVVVAGKEQVEVVTNSLVIVLIYFPRTNRQIG